MSTITAKAVLKTDEVVKAMGGGCKYWSHNEKRTGVAYRQCDQALKEAIMTTANDVDAAILEHLATRGSCTVGELSSALTDLTLNQVLFAIDRLSRNEKLVLRRPSRFEYLLSPVWLGAHPGETDKDVKSVR